MAKKAIRPTVVQAGFTDTGLPTPETVERAVSVIAPQVKPVRSKAATITADDLRTPAARQPGQTNKGRVKFTTMLKPELRLQLENIATNRACSVADVLEIIVTEYLDGLRKSI